MTAPIIAELKKIRREGKHSQIKVAVAAGFYQNDISRWEKGAISPSLHSFIAWAGALGFDVALVPSDNQRKIK